MKNRYAIVIGAAGVVLLDAWLKRVALNTFPTDTSVVSPGIIELVIHRNPGLAFNIPLQIPIVLGISTLLGAALAWIAWKHRNEQNAITIAALTVFVGGLGNMWDRASLGYTVDYLLLFGRSAINLSDIVIMGGIVWMLWAGKREETVDEHAKTS